MKGSYILLIELASNKDILTGKLGYISFPKAFYAYVGSAMNGLEARVARHLRREKKLHWHIDYLLSQSEIADITLCPSEPFASCHSEGAKQPKNLLFTPFRASAHQGKLRTECLLAQELAKDFQCIPGFGCSDCHCNSHLYFDGDTDKLKAGVVAACKSVHPQCHSERSESISYNKH